MALPKAADEELLPLIRRLVDDQPSYGYRRVTALVNRVLAAQGKPAANHRRVFRIMKQQGLLLQRHTVRRKGRLHSGKVVVMRSNLRWRSDVFETTCWKGEMVAYDREVLAWHGCLASIRYAARSPNGIAEASSSERSSAIMLAYIHCRMPLQCSGRSPGGSTITTRGTHTQGSE